jgi:hypothetical protein
VVYVDDLATFGVDAEYVYSLVEFLSLKYNSLKDLKKRLVCFKASEDYKYLCVAFNIDDRKVSFSFWVLMEIC